MSAEGSESAADIDSFVAGDLDLDEFLGGMLLYLSQVHNVLEPFIIVLQLSSL